MSSSRVAAVVLRQLYLLRDSPARILPLFVWVAVDAVLWGYIAKYLNALNGGYNFVPGLLGAVLLWDFCGRVIHGVATAFLEDVWSRNFLNLFGSPLGVGEYLAGLILTSLTTSLLGLVAMMFLAGTVFGLSFVGYGLLIIPFLLILVAFGIALGILACAAVLRLGPAAEWLVWPIPAVLAPFAGVFYPVATLPIWMQWVSQLLPPSYVFEGMRSIVAGGGVDGPKLVVGGTLALACVLASAGVFTRVFHLTLNTGLLARYSAESVN